MKPDAELETLIECYLDGTISGEQMAKLNAHLGDDAEARREFAEALNLDSAIAAAAAEWVSNEEALSWEAETCEVAGRRSTQLASISGGTPLPRWAPFPTTMRWIAAAAACAALFAGAGWWWQTTQRVFATVGKGVGGQELASGKAIRGGLLEIKAGTVEMVTARGARVVIEAPAAFRFESAQRLHMSYGRVAADVPPSAKGFTVVTPTGKAVDLGTKFGVDVPLQGEAEIHVFQGEVVAQSSGGGKERSLHGGEAFSLQSGGGAARELRSSAFIRPDEVASLHAALAAGQRARSDALLVKVRRDPALIALLDFESDDLPPGSYRIVQGRWPGSRAPEFVNVGDHMKLDVGGDRAWPQLTLAAWVRLDQLGEPYQSLIHTDGWNKNNPGQVHWMVTRNTTMRLALQGNTLAPGSEEHDRFPDSRTPVLPEQGRWTHMAAVYDSAARTVRFYLNGRFDKESHQEIAHPARLGSAQIGNWDQQDRKLSGRIDEIVILGRAMSDDEVRALFSAGNPYR